MFLVKSHSSAIEHWSEYPNLEQGHELSVIQIHCSREMHKFHTYGYMVHNQNHFLENLITKIVKK
jgi:hypothetical protein